MNHHFDIQPLNRFAGSSAAIRRPREIACFSYDDSHDFHLDGRSLRYYYTPRIGADLSRGFDTFRPVDDSVDEHLDGLLKTIVDLEKRMGGGRRREADVVTWRGMMTKIMATPFDDMAGFEMNATRFQDTIFLEENHPYKLSSRRQQQQQQQQQPSHPNAPSQDLMSYWGYKFETLSLLSEPWHHTSRDYIEAREDMPVSNHAQYCSVVKTGVGKTKLVLGGEVDGVWDCKPTPPLPPPPAVVVMEGGSEQQQQGQQHQHQHQHQHQQQQGQPINWVELKTTAEIVTDRDAVKFERKLLKFWIQSFLLGVPKIVVGFRSKNGILQRLEELETKDIPGMVRRSRRSRGGGGEGKGTVWDGNLCINFTAGVLEWLKTTVVGEGVWRVRRRERSPVVEVFKVEEEGTGDILSREFVEWRTTVGQGAPNGDEGVVGQGDGSTSLDGMARR